ncbi:transposase [Massilia scottii]|uniref:transposase n=1 Tax=Massilia scottii TaxID=3057166 RepID=UPI0035B5F405
MPTSTVEKRWKRSVVSGSGAACICTSLPPYSPELNRIEILWKQAKYFWRKFVRHTAGALVDEVNSIMTSYGTEFTINFR